MQRWSIYNNTCFIYELYNSCEEYMDSPMIFFKRLTSDTQKAVVVVQNFY